MQIVTESEDVKGSKKCFYCTVRMQRKLFLTGTESVKYPAKFWRPVIVTGKANVSKVRENIESDGRYTIRIIAIAVGISLSRVYFILKHILSTKYFYHMDTIYIVRRPTREGVRTAK